MRYFLAKSPKQLDICLRLLYAERIPFKVDVVETDRKRIVYHVTAMTDEERIIQLEDMYRILTS